MEACPLECLPYSTRPAAENMAIDAELAAWGAARGVGVLRFYGWTEAALTIGYSQRWEAAREHARAVLGFDREAICLRRPSGGGIVDHRDDLTYAFALPSRHPACREPSTRFYCALHGALAEALDGLGVAVRLAPCPVPGGKAPTGENLASCFADPPAPADLVLASDGAKLAGAALRRSPRGLLAQGSLARSRLPHSLLRPALEEAFASALADTFGCATTRALSVWPTELPSPQALIRFQSEAWNARR
jgi:lipoyl(octanoyl) transferase